MLAETKPDEQSFQFENEILYENLAKMWRNLTKFSDFFDFFYQKQKKKASFTRNKGFSMSHYAIVTMGENQGENSIFNNKTSLKNKRNFIVFANKTVACYRPNLWLKKITQFHLFTNFKPWKLSS